MAEIIYRNPERNEEYLIDEDAQQLLAYLYLYDTSQPNGLSDRLNYENKKEIIKEINDNLGRDELGFISLRYTDQVTIEEYTDQITLGENNVPEISLTNAGRKFVKKHRFEIRAPFSVHTFVQEMKKKERSCGGDCW